jgi:hypothetical protein
VDSETAVPVTSERPLIRRHGERFFLAGVLAASLMQGLIGIAKYGYCGQDFAYHYKLLVTFPQGFSYEFTNPPGIYFLGYLVRRFLSDAFVLEATAFILLVGNVLALWLLHFVLKRIIGFTPLRCAALLIAAFVPFRVVHSIVYSADAVTVPLFVLVAWLAIRLFEKGECASCLWAMIGGLMTMAVFFKYTFVGMLPALALIAVHQFLHGGVSGRARRAVAAAAVLSLAVPGLAVWMQLELSRKAGGYTMEKQWLPPHLPREMTLRDMLLLKSRDVELLKAPQYFQDAVYETHRHSYPGLVHLAMFTDLLNYFQRPPEFRAHLVEHQKDSGQPIPRRPIASALSPLAVVASLPLSAAALAGTILASFGSARRLLTNGGAPLAVAVLTSLALGFYAPIILNIRDMWGAYQAGYWLPRLVMPSLVTFLMLGFVLADRMLRARNDTEQAVVIRVMLAYAAIMSMVYVAIT